MKPARASKMTLSTPEQLRAICSPLRFELMDYLNSIGPCSVADLGRAMDRPADGLYRHIRVLIQAGLVVKRGERPAGKKRREWVIDTAAESFVVDYNPSTGRNAKAYQRVTHTVFRAAAAHLRAINGQRGIAHAGPGRNLITAHETARLSDRDVARLVSMLEATHHIFERGHGRRQGRLFSLTTIFVPIVRRRSSSRTRRA